jgi:hypothetical protein
LFLGFLKIFEHLIFATTRVVFLLEEQWNDDVRSNPEKAKIVLCKINLLQTAK